MSQEITGEANQNEPIAWHTFAKRVVQVLRNVAMIGVALFISAGTLRWGVAWLYIGVSTFRPLGHIRFVRHPGYVGLILGYVGAPLSLGC